MTTEQIEQAARNYASCQYVSTISCEANKCLSCNPKNCSAIRRYEAYVAGANSRQPEIDTLTTRIAQLEADCEKYRTNIAEGLKREEIARKEIDNQRKVMSELEAVANNMVDIDDFTHRVELLEAWRTRRQGVEAIIKSVQKVIEEKRRERQ